MKVIGCFMYGKWFCSEHCSEKDTETKQLKDLYQNGIEFNNKSEEDPEEEEEVDIDL